MRVVGHKELTHLSKQLERESRRVKTGVLQELRAAVKPVGADAQEHARQILPHRGGLNEWVAGSDMKVNVDLKGSKVSVRLAAKRKNAAGKPAKLQNIDSGIVRHRAFGRNQWFDQKVHPGWFTEPAKDAAPEIEHKLLNVLDDIERRLKQK